MNKSTNLSKIKNLFLKGEIAVEIVVDGNLTFYIVLFIVYICMSSASLMIPYCLV